MEKAKILVADDEIEIQQLLKRYLEREGYNVDTASDGEMALFYSRSKKYELIILDIMMPKIDGIEVCRIMRNETNVPILMLTAKDDEIDKVLGLGIGADDYITKPFSINEVVARVKAHLRRFLSLNTDNREVKSQRKFFGDIAIDFSSYTVYKDNEVVALRTKEFELLKFFANNPNQVFTLSQIFRNVWGDEYYEDDNTVRVHIRRLRQKIERDPDNPELIQTVWRIGYKLVGDQ